MKTLKNGLFCATAMALTSLVHAQVVQPSFVPINASPSGVYEPGDPGLDYQENHYPGSVIFNNNAAGNYAVHTSGSPPPDRSFTDVEPFFDHGPGGTTIGTNNRAFLDGGGENFTVRVNGFVQLTTTGDYIIHIGADDTNFFVMDTLDGIVMGEHNCCPQNNEVPFTITQPGTFPFDNVFGEQGGGEWGDLGISGPGIVGIVPLGDTVAGSPPVFLIAPDSTDTDGDGMPDGYETANGLDPNDDGTLDPSKGPNGDLDGDGLTNLQEFVFRTNPNNQDSDGDGFNDDVEVRAGTNPNRADDFPPPTVQFLELISPTELRIQINDVPAGQTFHLRGNADLDGFLPLSPPFEFDANTVFPTTITVDQAAHSAEFFQIWAGTSPPVVGLPLFADFDADDGGFVSTTFDPRNASGAAGPWVHSLVNGVANGPGWSVDGGLGGSAPFEQHLDAPMILVPADGEVTLEFDHFHNFEANWDGGVVMFSVNDAPYQQVLNSAFSMNGYNDVVQTTNDWGYPDDMNGLEMFSNVSFGFIHSVATLGELKAGDILRIRFRGGWDWGALNGAPNWRLDNVEVTQTPTP